jgi:hypothetical protein
LGGKKSLNKALRQAVELQAVLLAARLQKTITRTFWGIQLQGEETKDNQLL